MKICLFGGTFDPVHIGHDYIVKMLLKENFDKIIIMPTGNVDYKEIKTNKKQRLEMVKLWMNKYDDPRLIIDEYEVNLKKNSTTYDTLLYLQNKYNVERITMAIGYDSYKNLNTWYNYEKIKKNIDFLIFNRQNSTSFVGENILISSTELRKNFNPNLVVEEILDYVVTNQIYNLQDYIVQEMEVKPKIKIEEEIKKRCLFLHNQMTLAKKKTMILAISGGQDSTLAAKLVTLTCEKYHYNAYFIRLPYKIQFDEADCQDVIKWLDTKNVIEIDISPYVDLITNNVENISDFNKGNLKSRTRMVIQYALAGKYDGLVVGTDHSAENLVGFFTKYGDGGVDLNPLFGLNKRQGKEILKYLNCPTHLYQKEPTADLEEEKPALPDEEALGITYQIIDDYLENKKINLEDKIKIEKLYIRNIHKRKGPINYK